MGLVSIRDRFLTWEGVVGGKGSARLFIVTTLSAEGFAPIVGRLVPKSAILVFHTSLSAIPPKSLRGVAKPGAEKLADADHPFSSRPTLFWAPQERKNR